MFIIIFFMVLWASPTFSITGGEKAKWGEFPFQVQLYDKGEFICGGSILSPFTVATAAHCFWDEGKMVNTEEILVVGGSLKKIDRFNFSRIPKGIQISGISVYFEHPEYNKTTFENDLAIIKVDRAFTFTQNVGRIHLPKSNENFDNSNATVVGNGASNISMSTTHLLKLHLPYGNNSNCKRFYEEVNKEEVSTEHCVLVEDGVGLCPGDSGGPLICYRNENGSIPVLCGIASYILPRNSSTEDFKCGKWNKGVFTRVQSFLQWIKSRVSSVEASMRCDREHFFCFSNEKCIERKLICNQVDDCPDGEDELECLNYKPCSSSEFRCSNGNCLEKTDLCDLTFDCGGVYNNNTLVTRSDEEKCPKLENEMCKTDEHDCGPNDRCIRPEFKCDGVRDCKDLSDEKYCGKMDNFPNTPFIPYNDIKWIILLLIKITSSILILYILEELRLLKTFLNYLKSRTCCCSAKIESNIEEDGV